MSIEIVVSILLTILSVVIFLRYLFTRKKVKELKSKTDFSIQSDNLMKLSFEGDSELGAIATNFNTLVGKYQDMCNESVDLRADHQQKVKLDSKVKEFEESLSQMTLLTDIGKRITASLNVEEIMRIVYDYVKSAMDVNELELMYFKNGKSVYLSLGNKSKISKHSVDAGSENIMHWSLENKEVVFLNNAHEDYTQYVFNPVVSFSGEKPHSAICIPLFLNEKKIGAVGVTSSHKDVYNVYHLEFLKTLATYLAVALDNSNVYQLLESGKAQIEAEKAKSDKLLLNILPAEVAEELKNSGKAKAKSFKNVTVLFTDFVNFTSISENLTPEQLVVEIDTCFKAFDNIIENNGLEKIKTIGDAYLAVGGLPNDDPNHGFNAVKAAIEIRNFIKERESEKDAKLKGIRIGLHSGPVVAGIVGVKKFAYDIWGDTVNTAARMEQQSETGKVNISGATYSEVKDKMECTYRGKVEAKNKGKIDMYFVDRIK
ncbi:MAG: class 3 adenylate cyclase [Bacteroidia bacterium]|jgi:class 3 adenylate cyclase